MSRKLIVASSNAHKIKEIKDILKDLNLEILDKNEAGLQDLEVIEDKETLEGNSIKKAKEISERVEGIVIADDTGLFVKALGEEPGVYSARYAGENATYIDNNKKLLQKLENIPLEEREAEFRTVIALVLEDKSVKTITGRCSGKIAFNNRGDNGFGYDPLFIVNGYDKTFAELGDEIKNKISHRADALNKLKVELEKVIMGENSSN